MKNLLLAVALILPAISFAHDHGHEPGKPELAAHLIYNGGALHAHVFWEAGPVFADESILLIEFKNGANHEPVIGPASFEVTTDMPAMPPHDNPPTNISPVLDDKGAAVTGSFRVNDIFLYMGGLWNLNITITNADGSRETQTVTATVSEDGGGDGSGHDHGGH